MKKVLLIVAILAVAIVSGWFAHDYYSFKNRIAVLEKEFEPIANEFSDVVVAFSCSHRPESVYYFGKVKNEEEKERLIAYLSKSFKEDARRLCGNIRTLEQLQPAEQDGGING